MAPEFESDFDEGSDEEDFEPRPPIHLLPRPPASVKGPPATSYRWRPWSGGRILEDIPEIKSQDSLEIRSGNVSRGES